MYRGAEQAGGIAPGDRTIKEERRADSTLDLYLLEDDKQENYGCQYDQDPVVPGARDLPEKDGRMT
ncbi:hypothetical protein D3C73_1652830 [compost metagenome]